MTTTTDYDLERARAHFRARVAFTTGVHELERLIAGGAGGFQIVDVRYPADFAQAHVPGAVNLPKGKWRNAAALSALDRNATLYVYCYTPTCHLAAEAALELTAQGYRVVEVEGGWERWVQDGFSIEKAA